MHKRPTSPYIGFQRYFLTLSACAGQTRFADRRVVEPVRWLLLRLATVRGFSIPAYCFLPGRLDLLAEGMRADADLRRFVSAFKQQSAEQFDRSSRRRLWQDGYRERILRGDEQTIAVAAGILNGPVRAGLVEAFDQYLFSGSDRYTMPEIADVLARRRT